jgi:hypothetical protein
MQQMFFLLERRFYPILALLLPTAYMGCGRRADEADRFGHRRSVLSLTLRQAIIDRVVE